MSSSVPAALSKKPKKLDGGLRANWDAPVIHDKDIELPDVELPPLSRSVSAGSAMSISSVASRTSASVKSMTAACNKDIDSEDEPIGGISDNEGEFDERKGLIEDTKPSIRSRTGVVGAKVQMLARIVPTISVPDFIPPKPVLRRNYGRHYSKKKADIRLTDLPQDVQRRFDSDFSPQLCEFFGTLRPWKKLDGSSETQTIQKIWVEVFPSEDRLEENEELAYFTNKMVEDILTAWRNKFSSTASKFITNTVFAAMPNNKETRATWATWAIGSDSKENQERTRRFYYREYEDSEDPDGSPLAKGIFQAPIIAATLAMHYQWITKIHPASRLKEHPKGALGLCIQACYHHIAMWTTGSLVQPDGTLGHFSAGNWDDHKERRRSRLVDVNLTTDLMCVINKLQDKTWKRITASALDAVKWQKKVIPAAPVVDPAPITAEPEFEILDDDSDLDVDDDPVLTVQA